MLRLRRYAGNERDLDFAIAADAITFTSALIPKLIAGKRPVLFDFRSNRLATKRIFLLFNFISSTSCYRKNYARMETSLHFHSNKEKSI